MKKNRLENYYHFIIRLQNKGDYDYYYCWDDGNQNDEKLASLLDKVLNERNILFMQGNYGLSNAKIKEISLNHEIGAHGINHLDLTKLSSLDIKYQMLESKKWLEDIIEKEITIFCYPYGYYNDRVKLIAEEIGLKEN